ncbi:MAG: mycothiol system anti-sigma-R factor [Rothia sp. (in: high G+C Gram-positive bacteria)]|uniref:mycothiol system anti-sigma-R factor n=1 Tax=Rothia sp. (in: high G+C Gram-positive bacteria) TaxID=1885016 RepID=UPI0026DEDAA9|nr:mycothiol system anti-sigma-R factor [Rothia sp. (in: high G+C Gram-positive bacteria)]MDO5750147.1 mycothiol system anti-sigma-R factor [Rothia sp. (in: high G+C Gram-positive bacteria)]
MVADNQQQDIPLLSDTMSHEHPEHEDCLAAHPCEKTLQRLWEYLDNALSPEDVEQVREHLAKCSECDQQRELEQLVRDKVRSSCAESAPEELKASLLEHIEKFCAAA